MTSSVNPDAIQDYLAALWQMSEQVREAERHAMLGLINTVSAKVSNDAAFLRAFGHLGVQGPAPEDLAVPAMVEAPVETAPAQPEPPRTPPPLPASAMSEEDKVAAWRADMLRRRSEALRREQVADAASADGVP